MRNPRASFSNTAFWVATNWRGCLDGFLSQSWSTQKDPLLRPPSTYYNEILETLLQQHACKHIKKNGSSSAQPRQNQEAHSGTAQHEQ